MAVTITGTQIQFPSNGNIEGFYTGSTISNTSYPIGSYVNTVNASANIPYPNTSAAVYTSNPYFYLLSYSAAFPGSSSSTALAGTWVGRGHYNYCCCYIPGPVLMQRRA